MTTMALRAFGNNVNFGNPKTLRHVSAFGTIGAFGALRAFGDFGAFRAFRSLVTFSGFKTARALVEFATSSSCKNVGKRRNLMDL